MSVVEAFIIIFCVLFVWQIFIRVVRKLWHFPAPAFIGRILDSDHRRRLQPPATIIERGGIVPGMRVLEVGCGSGAYTTEVARSLGPGGRLVAFDIQQQMLAQLASKLQMPENNAHGSRIDLISGDATALPFCESSFDAVYMVTVLQEIPDRHGALTEIHRVLRPGGVLGVTEFLPDPDYPLKSTTIRQGERAGFVLDQVRGGVWNYTVRFRKG